MNKRIAFLLSLCWVVCCSYAQNSFSKHEVRQTMRRVADWQIAHMKEVTYDPLNWVNATFYLGLSKWASVAEQENQDDFYFRFLSVRLNRLKNKLLANYLRNRGNDLATVRNSAFCVAILSNNSFICKYNIFFRKYELSVAIL